MIKIDEKNKNNYLEKINHYKTVCDSILEQEQETLKYILENPGKSANERFKLSESMLNLISNYLIMDGLSQSILNIKNDEALNSARKAIYKSIIYLEEIVTNHIDAPFSYYETKLAAIAKIDPFQRYHLVRKMGLSIQLLKNAYGDNSKWKWTFVEIEGRFAAVAKNLINLRTVISDIEPSSVYYEPVILHLGLVKNILMQTAERYREMYEVSTKRTDDFIQAITFLNGLRRFNMLTGCMLEAASNKKKLDIWNQKLEADMGKDKKYSGRRI